jgi:hypothetical protein
MVNSILTDDARTLNTRKALDPNRKEFEQYCDYVGGDDIYRHVLCADKVYCPTLCTTRRSGRRRNPEEIEEPSKEESTLIRRRTGLQPAYQQQDGNMSSEDFPHPVNPVAKATFEQYNTALKNMHTEQVTCGVCGLTWELLVWQLPCNRLMKHVKERAPKVKKATYQEKVNGELAPYTMVERYDEIEQALWDDSRNCVSPRSINTQLRHRACCLYLTSGIFRSESLHHAELSDFLCLKPPLRETDIHPMFLLIDQIAEGKTKHGQTLYGRATRHRDVRLCAVGAIVFYLQFRSYCTKEFSNHTVDDWITNSTWFDIKFLVDLNGNHKKRDAEGQLRPT